MWFSIPFFMQKIIWEVKNNPSVLNVSNLLTKIEWNTQNPNRLCILKKWDTSLRPYNSFFGLCMLYVFRFAVRVRVIQYIVLCYISTCDSRIQHWIHFYFKKSHNGMPLKINRHFKLHMNSFSVLVCIHQRIQQILLKHFLSKSIHDINTQQNTYALA